MASRDQITRILGVANALSASRRGISLTALAERHQWKLRSLYRDIEALEQAGFPIVHENGRYRIAETWSISAAAGIQSDELGALFLARQVASSVRVTALGRALDRLWSKLTAAPKQASLVPSSPLASISVRAPSGVDYAAHSHTIATIERAISDRLALSCRYHALSTGTASSRVIEPGQLHWDPGLETLYLIAWCRQRQQVRVFAVHRFKAVVLTDEHFLPRPRVSSQSALRNAFRVWRSSSLQQVRIRFCPSIAPEISERRWHPSQSLAVEEDGVVVLTLEVAGLDEIERWVLSYGERAMVLGPPELVNRVAARSAQAARLYSKSPRRRVRVRLERNVVKR